MEYRFASQRDAGLLARMNLALIRDEGHRNPMNLAQLEERISGWLEGEYSAVIFEIEGVDVGYALYRPGDEFVYLRQFYIKPELRRKNLGTQALRWLRENAWKHAKRIRLDVLISNKAAIEFWRAVGFEDYCLTMEMEN